MSVTLERGHGTLGGKICGDSGKWMGNMEKMRGESSVNHVVCAETDRKIFRQHANMQWKPRWNKTEHEWEIRGTREREHDVGKMKGTSRGHGT